MAYYKDYGMCMLSLRFVFVFISILIISPLTYSSASQDRAANNTVTAFKSTIEKELPELLSDYHVPGAAISIIRDAKIAHIKGYGLANVKDKKPVGLETGFNIGSISKTVTAWGIMTLVEQGKISLSDPVEKHLTRWKIPESKYSILSKEVTIERLLSHTSGLSLHGYPGWGPDDKLPTIEKSLNGINNGPERVTLIEAPGTRFIYSGGGYTVLQLLIEEVSGMPFSAFMEKNVLNPLGMRNTSFELTPAILSKSSDAHDASGHWIPGPRFTAKAAAGLHTTIEDFSKFAIASIPSKGENVNQTRLKAESVNLMLSPAPATNNSYGLGYASYEIEGGLKVYGHGGSNEGWQADFVVVPETGDGIVILTNATKGRQVVDHVLCLWGKWVSQSGVESECKRIKPAPEVKVDVEKLKKFVGDYEHQARAWSARVYLDGDQFYAQGKGLPPVKLKAISNNIFQDQDSMIQLTFDPAGNEYTLLMGGDVFLFKKVSQMENVTD